VSTFRRQGEHCVATFAPDEVRVLRRVASEVVGLLTDGFDRSDPVVGRLFPEAYPDSPQDSAEFRRYTEGDLKTGKIDQAGAVLATLPESSGGEVRLDSEAAEAWLRALNDARLAMGVRLNITADTDLGAELAHRTLAFRLDLGLCRSEDALRLLLCLCPHLGDDRGPFLLGLLPDASGVVPGLRELLLVLLKSSLGLGLHLLRLLESALDRLGALSEGLLEARRDELRHQEEEDEEDHAAEDHLGDVGNQRVHFLCGYKDHGGLSVRDGCFSWTEGRTPTRYR